MCDHTAHPDHMPHDHGQDIEFVLERIPPEDAFAKAADTFQQLCSTSKTYSNNTGKELLEYLEYTIRRFLYSSVTCFGIYNAESLLTRAFR